MVSSAPVNPALVQELERKAREKMTFDSVDPDQNYRFAIQMKLQIDNAYKNN